jgi:DNA-binding transcriptional ArsR family regulator
METATLSSSALEVLGALAPFGHSGPYRPGPLRRYTRLTPDGFATALDELEGHGLIIVEEESLWVTMRGEELANQAYP